MTAYARRTDPQTSKSAAASLNTTALEQMVLGAIMTCPDGATQDDIMAVLVNKGISNQSITPRIKPMLEKGVIVDTGTKRKGNSGRSQRVVKVADSTQAQVSGDPAQIVIPLDVVKRPSQMSREEANAAVSDKIADIKRLMREVDEIGAHHDVYTSFAFGDISISYDSGEYGWQSSY